MASRSWSGVNKSREAERIEVALDNRDESKRKKEESKRKFRRF